MLWFYMALSSAFFFATSDALSKKALDYSDEYLIGWLRQVFAVPLLALLLPFYGGIPPLDSTFFLTVAIALPLEITAILLYLKAIQVSPLSLTIPFLAFTPIYLIPVSYIILGELPDFYGVIGIFLVVTGAYLLHVNKVRGGIFVPLKMIFKEKGSRYMLVVALIYSFTATFSKQAILHSSPIFFSLFYFAAVSLIMTPIMLRRSTSIKSLKSGSALKIYTLIGVTYGLMIFCHAISISLIEVAYMISVKRLSLVIAVVYGWIFFQEKDIWSRLIGAIVMFTGVFFIAVL